MLTALVGRHRVRKPPWPPPPPPVLPPPWPPPCAHAPALPPGRAAAPPRAPPAAWPRRAPPSGRWTPPHEPGPGEVGFGRGGVCQSCAAGVGGGGTKGAPCQQHQPCAQPRPQEAAGNHTPASPHTHTAAVPAPRPPPPPPTLPGARPCAPAPPLQAHVECQHLLPGLLRGGGTARRLGARLVGARCRLCCGCQAGGQGVALLLQAHAPAGPGVARGRDGAGAGVGRVGGRGAVCLAWYCTPPPPSRRAWKREAAPLKAGVPSVS